MHPAFFNITGMVVLSKRSEMWQQTLVLQARDPAWQKAEPCVWKNAEQPVMHIVNGALLYTVHHCQIPVFLLKICLHCSVLQSHELPAIVASNSAILVFTALNFQIILW